MPIIAVPYKTITCDGPECKNTVTFLEDQGAMQKLANELPWFKTLRMVQNSAGRNFVYCSDECEIGNIGAGNHNPEERKSIILPTGANAQALAAEAAQKQIAADKAIRAGQPATLPIRG